MRTFLAITGAAAALAAAGCGGDAARDDPAQPTQTADQASTPAEQGVVGGLAAETDKLAEQIAKAVEELAQDPSADVDGQLESAQQRADELSQQAEETAGDQQPEVTAALREANKRIAAAAAELRGVTDAADVRAVLERQLGPISDQLGDAFDEAEQSTGTDTRQQVQKARDTINSLRDEIGP